jgi:hypothetical protein
LRANMMKDIIEHGVEDINQLTIGEALKLKNSFGLTNFEATYIFLGGIRCENVQVQKCHYQCSW